MRGILEVVVGCMFSGKTSEMLRRVERAEFARNTVAVYKPYVDNRYNPDAVCSHAGTERNARVIQHPWDIYNDILFNKWDVVGVDEAQFFHSDLTHVLSSAIRDYGTRVIVAGLDTDFRGEPFPTMVPIVFQADSLTKLNAICIVCGEEASRTQRTVDGVPVTHGDVVQVGGTEAYEARCRHCFVSEEVHEPTRTESSLR